MIEPNYFVGSISYGEYYKASDSEFTVVSLSYNFPSDQIDIQTMALVGNQVPYTDPIQEILYKFDGENSGWSNTQTITMPATSTSPTPTLPPDSTPTPNTNSNTFLSGNTQLTITVMVVGVLAVIIASLLLYIKVLKRQ